VLVFGGDLSLGAAKQDDDAGRIEAVIENLLAEVITAAEAGEARAKLDRARRLLRENEHRLGNFTSEFLRINLSQVLMQRAVAIWQLDTDREEIRKEAEKKLTDVLQRYQVLQEKAREEVDSLEWKYGDKVVKNALWRRMSGYVTRVDFETGWVYYNLGVITKGERRDNYFQKAIEIFGRFTEDGYRNHPVIAECFLGQGLCLKERQKYYEAAQLLDYRMITPLNTPADSYKKISYLRMQAWRAVPSELNAVWSAQQYFETLPAGKEPDRIELEMALEWARSLTALVNSSQTGELREALEQQLNLVAGMIYGQGEVWIEKLSEVIKEIASDTTYACLLRGRMFFVKRQYEEALRETEKALKVKAEKYKENSWADLRYIKAASCWNLERWEPAFKAAVGFLVHHEQDQRAEEMVRVGVQGGLRSMKSDKLKPGELLRFFDRVEKGWPDHEEMKKMAWYRGQVLMKAGRAIEAEKYFQSIGQDSQVYRQGLYGQVWAACQLGRDRLKMGTVESDDQAGKYWRGVVGNVEKYIRLSLSESEKNDSFRQRVGNLVTAAAQLMLEGTQGDPNEALKLIELWEGFSKGDQHQRERLWMIRLEAYGAAGFIDEVIKELDAILIKKEFSDRGRVERAVARVSDRLEKFVKKARLREEGGQAQRVDEKLIKMYRFLLASLTEEVAPKRETGEIALRLRLANCLFRRERYAAALREYRWLSQKVSRKESSDILRKMGLAYEGIGSYEEAAEMWRLLCRGLKPETDLWLEAHYHHILCYQRAGQGDKAKKLLAYFRLRYPQVEMGGWQRRFDRLEHRFNAEDEQEREGATAAGVTR